MADPEDLWHPYCWLAGRTWDWVVGSGKLLQERCEVCTRAGTEEKCTRCYKYSHEVCMVGEICTACAEEGREGP